MGEFVVKLRDKNGKEVVASIKAPTLERAHEKARIKGFEVIVGLATDTVETDGEVIVPKEIRDQHKTKRDRKKILNTEQEKKEFDQVLRRREKRSRHYDEDGNELQRLERKDWPMYSWVSSVFNIGLVGLYIIICTSDRFYTIPNIIFSLAVLVVLVTVVGGILISYYSLRQKDKIKNAYRNGLIGVVLNGLVFLLLMLNAIGALSFIKKYPIKFGSYAEPGDQYLLTFNLEDKLDQSESTTDKNEKNIYLYSGKIVFSVLGVDETGKVTSARLNFNEVAYTHNNSIKDFFKVGERIDVDYTSEPRYVSNIADLNEHQKDVLNIVLGFWDNKDIDFSKVGLDADIAIGQKYIVADNAFDNSRFSKSPKPYAEVQTSKGFQNMNQKFIGVSLQYNGSYSLAITASLNSTVSINRQVFGEYSTSFNGMKRVYEDTLTSKKQNTDLNGIIKSELGREYKLKTSFERATVIQQ